MCQTILPFFRLVVLKVLKKLVLVSFVEPKDCMFVFDFSEGQLYASNVLLLILPFLVLNCSIVMFIGIKHFYLDFV